MSELRLACRMCKCPFERTSEFWRKDKRTFDGYSTACKKCLNDRQNGYRADYSPEKKASENARVGKRRKAILNDPSKAPAYRAKQARHARKYWQQKNWAPKELVRGGPALYRDTDVSYKD